jgi:hypothetical protein
MGTQKMNGVQKMKKKQKILVIEVYTITGKLARIMPDGFVGSHYKK